MICTTCKQDKPVSEFYRRKEGGFVVHCKRCISAKNTSNRKWGKHQEFTAEDIAEHEARKLAIRDGWTESEEILRRGAVTSVNARVWHLPGSLRHMDAFTEEYAEVEIV
jgi:hypothetical protein